VPFTITSATDSLTEAIPKLKTQTMNRWSHRKKPAKRRKETRERQGRKKNRDCEQFAKLTSKIVNDPLNF
jgi:hypothetical protein